MLAACRAGRPDSPDASRSSELKNHVTAAMTKTHPAGAAAALQCRSRRHWKLPPALPRHCPGASTGYRCRLSAAWHHRLGRVSAVCPLGAAASQQLPSRYLTYSRGGRKAGRCPEGWLIRVPICQSPVSFVIPRGTGEEQLVVSMPVAYKMQAACPGRCPEVVINSA